MMSNEAWAFTSYDLIVLGVALTFVAIDRASLANRALTAVLFLLGTDQLARFWREGLDLSLPPAWVVALHPEVFIPPMIAELLWLEAGTLIRGERELQLVRRLLRFCQIVAVVHVAARMLQLNFNDNAWDAFGIALLVLSALLVMRRLRNSQESIRLIGLALYAPFLVMVFYVNGELEDAALRIVGVIVLFTALMRFQHAQGARGEFLARFLSPQVGELVRARGLQQALRQSQQDITAVSCDLRGFTAYAQAHDSDAVVGVLADYYNAVCKEVARCGGTVKDFAGDGILVLIGAPLPVPDHARLGVELAHAIVGAARAAIAPWSRADTPLGIGVGVASGQVTVGVVDAAARAEYVAVGPAVSVAAQLCSQARDGEILIDKQTLALSGGAVIADPDLSLFASRTA